MNMKKSITYGLAEIEGVVDYVLSLRDQCAVFTFTGSLGAGKTTLVRRVLERVGVQGVITSPTFTYVNAYKNQRGQTFYHFDLYRIGSLEEFQMQGFDEFLYAPDSWSFIEWPEVVMSLLTLRVCHATIEHTSDGRRTITFQIKGDRVDG